MRPPVPRTSMSISRRGGSTDPPRPGSFRFKDQVVGRGVESRCNLLASLAARPESRKERFMRSLGRLLAGLGVSIALVHAMPCQAQYFGQNKVQYHQHDWKSITSDHFEVYFYSGLDSLAMRVLDLAEKTNVMLSKRMGHALGRRIPVIIYGSHN